MSDNEGFSDDESHPGSEDGSYVGSDDEGSDDDERPLKKDQKKKINYALGPAILTDLLVSKDVPEACQLLSLRNVAIPMTYLVSGLTQGFLIPILTNYAEDIGATSGQQGNISALYTLPIAFKIFMGFATDNFHFGGYRRRPALFLGWFIATSAMVFLMIGSNTKFTPGQVPPPDVPSMARLGTAVFFYGFGSSLASTVADGMTAEKYQLEKGSRGNFLTSCLAFRYFGATIAVSISTFVYSNGGAFTIFTLLLIFPALLLMIIMYLEEDVQVDDLKGVKKNVSNLWDMIQTRAVWQPMAFIFLFHFVQVNNLAWFDFLDTSLGFNDTQLNVVVIVSLAFVYFGVITFKYAFMLWSWKVVYCSTTVMRFLGSLMQILLARQVTFGVGDFVFASFSEAWLSFIAGVQLVPVNLMMVAICPKGGEATAFAFYTTIANFSLFIAGSIGTLLVRSNGITDELLSDQTDSEGPISRITLYAAFLSLSGVLFLSLMPHSKEEVDAWKKTTWNMGGYMVIGMVACGFLYTLTLASFSIASGTQ